MPVEYEERVNGTYAKYLYTLDLAQYKEILSSKDVKSTVSKIKSYLNKLVNNNFEYTFKYNYVDNKEFGRLYSGGAQGLPKVIRGALLADIATDIDIINCHPNILLYVCGLHGIQCPNLKYYVDNRDKILIDMTTDMGITKEQAKEYFLKSTNDCNTYKTKYEFFQDYDREMKKIQKKLMGVADYSFILPYADAKERNKQGTFINLVMCYYENRILQDTIEYIQGQGLQVFGLFFDGLMVHGTYYDNTELLDGLNQFIKSKWSYPFKYSYKAHDTSFEIPGSVVVRDVPSNYEIVKDDFNKNHVKVGKLFLRTDTNETYKVAELKDRYGHLGYSTEDGTRKVFINRWIENTTDDMVVYDCFGCYPDPSKCPPVCYNLWKPFKYEGIVEPYEQDNVGLHTILRHIDSLCNFEKATYDFILMWLAQMFQFPDTKSVCPIFNSDTGTGKTIFINFIGKLLGPKKFFETSQPDKTVWGDFNGAMKECFLVHFTEICSKHCSDRGVIYNLITDDDVYINEKGKTPFTIQSYHRFIGSTNSDFPIATYRGDRRFVLIRSSDVNKGNAEYFKTLLTALNDPIVQRTFYDYLIKYPTKRKITEVDLPETDYHKQLKNANRDVIELLIEDIVMKNLNSAEVKYSSDELFDMYRTFCCESNCECKLSKMQFSTKLGLKKTPGITSRVFRLNGNGKKVNGRVFSLPALREYFEIENLPDLLD